MANKPRPAQDSKTGQFLPGNVGGGRPKGSRNQLGEIFIQALQDDFEKDGVSAIVACRTEKPDVYLKVIASIVPKELRVTTDNDLTDDELIARIRQLDAAIRPFLTAEGEDGPAGGDRPATSH